ncbi:MAG TPA: hypothetical protein PKL14_07375 [Holophaga sp.]|jgi:hypothetical protein|nr:hypothetical protein [Holophaga sp.]
MLFKPNHSLSLLQGKLDTIEGRSVLIGLDGAILKPGDVAFVVPDDEGQAATIQAAGYSIHTPMSMHLGKGATAI